MVCSGIVHEVKALTDSKASPLTPEGVLATQLRQPTWIALVDTFLSSALQEASGQRKMAEYLETLSTSDPRRAKSLIQKVPQALQGWRSSTRDVWRAPLERGFAAAVQQYVEHVILLRHGEASAEITQAVEATDSLADMHATGASEHIDPLRLKGLRDSVLQKFRQCQLEEQISSAADMMQQLTAQMAAGMWTEVETSRRVQEARSKTGFQLPAEDVLNARVLIAGLAQEIVARVVVVDPHGGSHREAMPIVARGPGTPNAREGASSPVVADDGATPTADGVSQPAGGLGEGDDLPPGGLIEGDDQPPRGSFLPRGDVSAGTLVSLAQAIQAWMPGDGAGARALETLGRTVSLNHTLSDIVVAVSTRGGAKIKEHMKVVCDMLLSLTDSCLEPFAADAVSFLGASSALRAQAMKDLVVQIRDIARKTCTKYHQTLASKARRVMVLERDTLASIAGGAPDGSSWKNGCEDAEWTGVEAKITEYLFENDVQALHAGCVRLDRAARAYEKCAALAALPIDEIARDLVPSSQTLALARATHTEDVLAVHII